MSINLTTYRSVLQAKADAITASTRPAEIVAIAAAIEKTSDAIALSDVVVAGDAKVTAITTASTTATTAITTAGNTAVNAVVAAGTSQTASVNNAGDDKIAEIEAIIVSTGAGDVLGPTASQSNELVLFSGTSGKQIKVSGVVPSAFGLARITDTSSAVARAALGLAIGTDVQPYDADLAAIAAVTTTTYGRSLLTPSDAAGARTILGVVLGTAAGNVPVLDGSGKLATSILPALAITSTSVVASQAAMLALSAEEGDVAIRSDLNKSFVLASNSPGTLADWKELLTPTDAVLSVAGLTGSISSAALLAAIGAPVLSTAQTLTAAAQLQARTNIGTDVGNILGETTLASAATCDIGAATSRAVLISGTTTITSFGTAALRERLIRFSGALTLTHNATSLILPGGANIATAAGDTAIATSDASGNWRVRDYQRANGKAVIPSGPTDVGVPYIVAESIGGSGYRQWSDGYIEQWGYASPSSGQTTITFPVAFPNSMVALTVLPNSPGTTSNLAFVLWSSNAQPSYIVLQSRFWGGSAFGLDNTAFFWKASGR